MTIEEITKIVAPYIQQAKRGAGIENPKCDFKRQWYNLTENKGLNEFIKDTSAMANTIGLDGFIIIGLDTKTLEFQSAKFGDSNLKDSSILMDIISRRVDPIYICNHYDVHIEGHSLSVLHIPPSVSKPHVIRNHQQYDKDGQKTKDEAHRIFTRKNTSTYPATSHDLELMYFYRQQIQPEFEVITTVHSEAIYFNIYKREQVESVDISLILTIENLGRRPIAIRRIEWEMSMYPDPSRHESLFLSTKNSFESTNIIVNPSTIVSKNAQFVTDQYNDEDYEQTRKKLDELTSGSRSLGYCSLKYFLSAGSIINGKLRVN